MLNFFNNLFSNDFMPHGHCYFWTPVILWTHVISDLIIMLAYYSIPVALVYFVKKRKDVPFNWVFLMFGAFIFLCGTTHVMDVWTTWNPSYGLEAIIKMITAAVSIVTAISLWPLIPKALKIPSIEETHRINQELEAVNRELEAFAYSVSHDLRAPLRTIDGFSQALLEDCANSLDQTGQDHLNRIRNGVSHMAQLIDDMIDLSRVSRSEMNFQTINLSSLSEKIADVIQKENPSRRVIFSAEPNVTVQGDDFLLSMALENMLRNAWKFTAKHDEAHIQFGKISQHGKPVYFIRDDGAGFDMAYAGKLFGTFQRLHSTKEFQGTGIGLATVQRIIHRHGGRIWAESKPEQGATFYFTLGSS